MSRTPGDTILTRFRPAPRQRVRIAVGVALVVAGILGNVVAYTSLDRRVEVVQLVTDVRAGSIVTSDDVRIVAVDVDPTVPVTPAAEIGSVVDRYARVHLVSGTLVSSVLVQAEPLLAPGTAVVAVELRPTLVPTGIRERSSVELIVAPDGRSDDGPEPVRATGRVVTRPSTVDGVTGLVSMSIETEPSAAVLIAAADDIRIVLLDPGTDAVYAGAVSTSSGGG